MDIINLKNLGNLQANYMFVVYIPQISIYENQQVQNISGTSFSVLSRTAEIPALTKAYKNIRFLNNQVAVPFGDSHEGEITFNIVMEESHDVYDILVKWYDSLDSKNVVGYNPFATAYIELRDLNNQRTKIFRINGLSPKHIPPITEMSHDNIEGFVVLATNFAFDSIDYNLTESDVPSFG